jgi:bacterioferritin-associated ferredoxin
MHVCSCRRVTDRTVEAAILGGAGSIDELTARCAAGSGCGGCWPELQRLIDRHEAHLTTVIDSAVA